MREEHKIYLYTELGRDWWECSCGISGSAPEGNGDLAADKHIGPDDLRIDTNRPLYP